ncbi:MAG: helix-turn-helix domain-containing protein [Nitrososphaerota archaeon]|nr:helix-turn-helix domain-containing protein [Nitrososphaerota archaeon]MDG7023295.1 helix-turn-helix domain-containing protein [Nitrososphaerota archaeon]
MPGLKDWISEVRGPSTNVRLVSCRPSGPRGVQQFVMLNSSERVGKALRAVRSHKNVLHYNFTKTNDHRAVGSVVTRNSPLCRVAADVGAFCIGCYFSDGSTPREWHVVVEEQVSLDRLLRSLQRKGVRGRLKGVESMRRNSLLTFEQEKVLKIAEERGYFRFPRVVGIHSLAELLGMAPATLSEVLRRAEGKVISNFTSESRHEPHDRDRRGRSQSV